MKVSARINNQLNQHQVFVQTDSTAKEVQIAPRESGYGSSVNGAELLLLSLATCFCNDIYREAAKRNIIVTAVDVDFTGTFGAEANPAQIFAIRRRLFLMLLKM